MNDRITLPIALEPVESSTIAAIGYSYFGAALYVQFKTGVVYRYDTVPGRLFLAFVAAESKGAFFAATFKDASKHPCTKLGTMPLPVAPSLPPVEELERRFTADSRFAQLSQEMLARFDELTERVNQLESYAHGLEATIIALQDGTRASYA